MDHGPSIKYIHGNADKLNQIEPLWQSLNLYHCQRSTYFKKHYQDMTFEKRKAFLYKKAEGGKMRVDLAIDESSGDCVGYLISSINWERIGEIDSIFVLEKYRGFGIGGMLIKKVLTWMKQNSVEEKIVEVSIGNEEAFGFYAKYGFLPRKTVLKYVDKLSNCL